MKKTKKNLLILISLIFCLALICICLVACAPANGKYVSTKNKDCAIEILSGNRCSIITMHGEGGDEYNTIDMKEMYGKTEFEYSHNNNNLGWIRIKDGYCLEVGYNNNSKIITHYGYEYRHQG